MRSGFPSHKYKEVKKAIHSLIKKGFIIWYNKSDKSIQLNKDKHIEIEKIIMDDL